MSDLNGVWDVIIHTYMGDQFSEHKLEVADYVLSGTITDKGNGNKVSIYETQVSDNKYSYKFTIKIPIGEMEFFIEGELKEDSKIYGNSSNAMGNFPFEGTKRD